MSVRAVPFLVTALLLGGTAQAVGADWVGKTLPPPPLGSGDRFGATLAVGNNLIAVGAYLADINGTDSGAVYFYTKIGGSWGLLREMTLKGEPGDQLGFDLALAIDDTGTRLLAGAPFARKNGVRCGAVRKIRLIGVAIQSDERIDSPACEEGAEFGSAVAVQGLIEAVGARGADRRRGRIFATFTAGSLLPLEADVRPGDELGTSLATDGQWLVAGAPFADLQGSDSGAVYVFASGQQTVQVRPQTGQARAAFGYSVALRGDRPAADSLALAVGAPLEDDASGIDVGAVHRFNIAGWAEVPLVALGAGAGDQLGASVSWGESGLFASASRAGGQGAVYPIKDNGARGEAIFSPNPVPQPGAEFGYAVATRGLVLVAGAFREGGSGAAYVFEQPQTVTVEFAPLETCAVESETVPLSVVVKTSDGTPTLTDVIVTLQTCPVRNDCVARSPSDFIALKESKTIRAGTAFGDTVQFSDLTIKEDSLPEDPESLEVRVSLGGQHEDRSITIHDSLLVLPAGPLNTTEGGGSDQFEIRLACPPKKEVRVFVLSTDSSEGIVSPVGPLRFPASGSTPPPQSVNLTGVDDSICDGTQLYQVEVSSKSADLRYHNLLQTIPAENADDDPAILSASQSVCVHPDNTVIYTIELSDVCPEARASSFEYGLPPEVSVVTASADTGTATVDYLAGSVVWNGSVPPAGNAVITIVGGLDPVAPGTEVVNPAFSTPLLSFDPVTFQAGEVGCFPEPP